MRPVGRPLGRPATGITPMVSFRPPADLRRAVDKWGEARGVSRSEAIRRLLELGLKAKGKA